MIPILFSPTKFNVDSALKDMFKKSQEEVEITYHERDTGAKLYRWATWGRTDNILCKSKDICIRLDTSFDLNRNLM